MRSWTIVSILLLTIVLAGETPAVAKEQEWRQRASYEAEDVVADDISEEIRFGREVAARMLGRYGLYQNDAITRYVTLVGRSLAQNTNRPELTFHFGVLNTSEINAYAAPGGYVFITRGALEQVRDEAELAGILAHEINHINLKHVVNELNIRASEGSAVSGLARLIGGSTESARLAFSKAVDKAMDILFASGYKQEDEIQADTGAVTLCALTGYDPSALTRYLKRISAIKGKATEVLDKTHPAYDTRIALIQETIEKEGIDPAQYASNKSRFDNEIKALK